MTAETIGIGSFQLYIGMVISGLFTGIGVAFGTYLVNKYFVKKTEKIMKNLERKIHILHLRIDSIKK